MDPVTPWYKKPIVWLSAAFGILVLFAKYLWSKNTTLEGDAIESKAKTVDAVLSQQQTDLKTQNDAKITALEAEKGRKLTDQELNDELNKI